VLDSPKRTLYRANQDAGTVSAIDVDTRQVAATITVGEAPRELLLDPAKDILYVANYGVDQAGGPSVSVIDTVTGKVVSSITVGVTRTADGGDFTNMGPMFLDPASRALYVRGGILSVIDTQKRKVVSKLTIPGDGGGTALDPSAHVLFLGNEGAGTVSVFDTSARKIVGSVKAPNSGPLILDPAGHVLYVGNMQDNSVSVIDTTTRKVTSTFSVGSLAFWGGVVDPAVRALYLFQPGKVSPEAGSRDTVTVIDTVTHKLLGTIPVGAEGPLTMEFPLVYGVVDPTTGAVYVECLLANNPGIQILQAG
jgi:YVTN family beta-propeller protein